MIDNELLELVRRIKNIAIANKLTIATAESCTGGLVASCLTSIEGSSDYFSYGFITYSNQAKTDLLNINPGIIEKFGAVSKETAEAMALGSRQKAKSTIAIAITGIAGPSGSSTHKPVGTVWFTVSSIDKIESHLIQFDPINNKIKNLDNRQIIRYLACKEALQLILQKITSILPE